ncbi:MAG: hypothetical protein P8Y97_17295, partial [Candidatus Lokiarchaeota archaeon]
TLSHIDQFHREEKAQVDLEISIENGILDINKFTQKIWDKFYSELLVDSCKVSQDTDQQYISELRTQDIKLNEEEIIWITKNSEGKIIWLELGQHNYINPDKGAGLEHLYQKHTIGQFERWGFKSPEAIAKFLLEIISDTKQNPHTDKKGWIVYEVKTSLGTQYLAFQIGSNGFIVTARPYKYRDGIKLFNTKS